MDDPSGPGVLWHWTKLETSMSYVSRRLLLISIALAAGWASPLSTRVQAETSGRTGLWGYDPVSYFTAGRPERGSDKFSFQFDDTTYWFASEQHLKMFAADPGRYAPQFKGYCTNSVARGLKAEVDPEAWAIWNGQLFVFGSKDDVPEFLANPGEVANRARAAWASNSVN